MNKEEEKQVNENLRVRSGEFFAEDNLVSFLYILMRDHLPVGTVESIVRGHTCWVPKPTAFSNGWLAEYAQDLAKRIRSEVR